MAKKKVNVSYASLVKKDFAKGDVVTLMAEVNSMPVGTLAAVKKSQFDGAVYFIEILTGEKHGTEQRVKAEDLMLHE